MPNRNNNTVLYVSSVIEKRGTLHALLSDPSQHGEKWKLAAASDVQQAVYMLQGQQIPLAISESDVLPGSWRELWQQMSSMPHLPLLIVTSRLADERLWAEVLNEGGWDVLAQPFDRTEVIRVVESAFRHWRDSRPAAIGAYRTMRVAS